MKVLSLKATSRDAVGKGHARSLRRDGMIPGMLYGPNTDPIKLSVELVEFQKLLRTSKTNQFLLDLMVNGIVRKVTIKELQKRPVSDDVLHIDFYEVEMDRKIKVSVPIVTVGTCKGVELGGMLQVVRREIEVLCLPDHIPDSVVVDVTDLDIGDSFHVVDLTFPDDIELPGGGNFTVLTILSQKAAEEDVVEVEEVDEEADEKSEDKELI